MKKMWIQGSLAGLLFGVISGITIGWLVGGSLQFLRIMRD